MSWFLRLNSIIFVASLAMLLAVPVQADEQCMTSYVDAQKLRASSQLLKSKEQLQTCAAEQCPPAIVKDCSIWLTEIDGEIPRLTVSAVGQDGAETLEVSVDMDGQPVAQTLSTKALALDPGEHKLRFKHREKIIEKTIIAQQGMRRTLKISFSESEASPARSDRGHPIAGYVIGLVGLGGVTVAAVYGIPYLQDLSAYNDEVKVYNTECDDGSGNGTTTDDCALPDPGPGPKKSRSTIADVSGAVGGAALAVGVGLVLYHYLSDSDEAPADESARKRSRQIRPIAGVAPTPGGMFGSVGVQF